MPLAWETVLGVAAGLVGGWIVWVLVREPWTRFSERQEVMRPPKRRR